MKRVEQKLKLKKSVVPALSEKLCADLTLQVSTPWSITSGLLHEAELIRREQGPDSRKSRKGSVVTPSVGIALRV